MPPLPTHVGAAPSAAGAWQLLQLHRPELALRMAEQLLTHDPADVQVLLARTEALRQLGRLADAAAAAKVALGAAPQSPAAYAALAHVVGQQGYLGQAEAHIVEAIALNPGSARYYSFLAQVQYLQQRPAEAIASAKAGLRVDAHHTDCLLWLAMAEEQRELPEAADASFAQVLHMAPNSALAHEWRGRLLLQRHEPHQAAKHLTEALRLAPGTTAVLLLLRRALRRQQWPAWLLRQRQQLQGDWRAGRPFSWRILVVILFTPVFAVRSWLRTRRNPLFKQKIPGQRRILLRKALFISILLAVLSALIYACAAFDLPPFFIIIPIIAALQALVAKRQQPT